MDITYEGTDIIMYIYNIIFMSGAHGVSGWVWGGGGWVSVGRRLFRCGAVWWLWNCRVWKRC